MARPDQQPYQQAPTWRFKVEWRPIPETAYEASNLGYIRHSKSKRILIPIPDRDGYLFVNIRRNGRRRPQYVSRLVLLAFVGEPPTPQHQAAHNDGERQHNNLWNLRWATPQENAADRWRHDAMRKAMLAPANDNQQQTGEAAA